jgi:hypothetical protein
VPAGLDTQRSARHVTKQLRAGECLLGALAGALGMPSVTLHRWRRAGWLRARKLPVPGGLWAVWAPEHERKRLTDLRQHQSTKFNQPIPKELTTPRTAPKK